MSEHASPSSDTPQRSLSQPTATQLIPRSSHATESSTPPMLTPNPSRARRTMPLFALGAFAGALALVMGLFFNPASLVYALITPPHTPDLVIPGTVPFQQFGFSVASAGDINGDNYGDIVVGADIGNKIFVYMGSVSGLTTTIFYSDTGLAGENLGWSVAGGDDVNNDDVDDMVVGAPISGTGSAYVYHGSSIGLPTRGATLTGELSGDQFGWSVAIIGDVNNDDIADVAVGAPQYGISNTGRVYIYHGPVAGSATPDTILDGESSLDNFGISVAGAGDVNGDGIDDLVVGAAKNGDGGIEAGKAYVFYGSGSGVSQGNFTAVIGEDNDKLGTSVNGAGDVNGDGFADVIVGADATDPGNPSPGYFNVYPGGPSGLITTTILYTQQGESNNDRYGFAVTGQGDLDGDGFADFAVGAYEFDASGPVTDTGKAYGYVACTNGEISPSLIFSDTGNFSPDSYGRSLAIVRDVNGDDIDDLVVGAYAAKNSAVTPPIGAVYTYYGVAGGCRPALEVTKTVGLANFPALYTNTAVITVPIDAAVIYTYTVRNTGNVTLTQHHVVDDKLGIVTQTAYTLPPGANVSTNITNIAGISATPGISITNVATWTGGLPITSPSGVTTPTNRALSALAVASAQVNISGVSTDQDGDGIPDNVESSDDFDKDGLPNYLDTDSDGDGVDDAVEAGPDPTNPIDRDGDGNLSYLDPDENLDTTPDVEIGGLSIAAPTRALQDQAVNFTANITAGTNVTYTWDFGDGAVAVSQSTDQATPDANQQTGIGQTTSHTYTASGFYIVTVTATNSAGEKQATKSIIIQFGIYMPRIMTIGIFQQ